MFELILFIMGDSEPVRRNMEFLKETIEKNSGSLCSVKIVDLFAHPDLAEQYRVFATPTLVKIVPAPGCRVVGDIGNSKKILAILGITEISEKQDENL